MSTANQPRARCPECGATYSGDDRFCAVDGSALTAAVGGADLIGRVLGGKYRVERLIGSGGMGDVFQVRHVRLDEKRALKLMQGSALTNPVAVERFRREAKQQNRIRHPNVATLYDFEEEADGTCFLVMEFVDGQSLGELIRNHGALPIPRVAAIVSQIAAALDAAHEEGVVHRDLKPDNILIARARDGSDRVKVVDFGIATLMNRTADSPAITSTGMVIGTPRYMSPEQLFSEAGEQIDGRSDIYALGLLSIEMLLGRFPFGTGELADVLRRAASAPPMVSALSPEVGLPAIVDPVFAKVLASDRNHRYASASTFARDLVNAFVVAGLSPDLDAAPKPTPLDSLAFSNSQITPQIAPQITSPIARAAATNTTNTVQRGTGVRRGGWYVASVTVGVLAIAGVYLLRPTKAPVAAPGIPVATTDSTSAKDSTSKSTTPPGNTSLVQSAQAIRSKPSVSNGNAVVDANPSIREKLDAFRSMQEAPTPTTEAAAKQRIQDIRGIIPVLKTARDRLLAGLMTVESLIVLDDHESVCKLLPTLDRQSQGTDLAPAVTLYRDSIPCTPRPR